MNIFDGERVPTPGPVSDQLRIHVIVSVFARRWWRRFVLGVLPVLLSFDPALWNDHLLRPVRRRAQQGFDVVVAHHFALQQSVGKLEREVNITGISSLDS